MENQVYLDKSKKLKWGDIIELKSIPSLLKTGKIVGYQYKGKTKIYDIDTFPNSFSMDIIINVEWRIIEHENNFILDTLIENDDIKIQLYQEKLQNSGIKQTNPCLYNYLSSLISICKISIKEDFKIKIWEEWSDNYSNCGLCSKSFNNLKLKMDKDCVCPWDKRSFNIEQSDFNSGCYYTCMLFHKNKRVKGMNKNLKTFVKKYSLIFLEKQFKKLI